VLLLPLVKESCAEALETFNVMLALSAKCQLELQYRTNLELVWYKLVVELLGLNVLKDWFVYEMADR
jgi:hypothetical protein